MGCLDTSSERLRMIIQYGQRMLRRDSGGIYYGQNFFSLEHEVSSLYPISHLI